MRNSKLGFSALPSTGQEVSNDKSIRLTNGRWFDGRAFVERDSCVVDGVLARTPIAEIDRVLDLQNGFVIPPGAEAHNHNLEQPWQFEDAVSSYIEAGVFYVKIQCDISALVARNIARLNKPGPSTRYSPTRA